MPHFQIEYSANLEGVMDMGQLCEVIRAEAAQIAIFPMPGIRVRATRVDHNAIADGNINHGFVDLSVRLREGRSYNVKKEAIQRIFDVAKAYLMPVMTTHSITLSAEMRDIDAALTPKYGTIRDHLKDPK